MKTFTISYRNAILAILIAVLLVGAVVGGSVYITQKANQKIAASQAHEDQYKKQAATDAATISNLKSDNATISKQDKVIETRIVTREKTVTVEVNKVLDPTLSAEQVAAKAKQTLTLKHPDQVKVEGDMISFNKEDVQFQIATHIQRDWLKQDKTDLQQLLADVKKQNANLSTSLALAQKDQHLAEDVSHDWKTTAGATKKVKVIRGLEIVGALAGTAYASYEAGKHIH